MLGLIGFRVERLDRVLSSGLVGFRDPVKRAWLGILVRRVGLTSEDLGVHMCSGFSAVRPRCRVSI